LLELQQKLYGLQTEIKHKLPVKEGLILRPYLTSERARQVKLKYKALKSRLTQYASIKPQKKRGRPRQDSAYRNRVGRKAAKARKVL